MNSDKAQHILVTAPLGFGGITSMMINIQKNLDRDKLNFDYLVLHDRHEDLEDIVLGMGSKKIVASADDVRNKFLRGITRWYRLYRTFKDNNIKVLHLNGGPWLNDIFKKEVQKFANNRLGMSRNTIAKTLGKVFKRTKK